MKRFLAGLTGAVILTVSVLAALPVTAIAAVAPSAPEWTGPGQLTFYAPNEGDTRYYIEVYCDGNRVTRYDAGVCIKGTVVRDIRFVMDTAGTYSFRVKAADNDGDMDFSAGAVSDFSDGYWLAPAENKLGQPTELRWSGTKQGLAVWSPVDGAAKYHVVLYDNGAPVRGFLTFDSYYTQENLLPFMSGGAGHNYTFSVMAVSHNPGETGNSALSYSGPFTGDIPESLVPVVTPDTRDERVPFSDVFAGKYYTEAVVWAYLNGYISGYTDGRFGVNDACTRAQVVTILHKVNDAPQPTSNNLRFTDVPGSSYYAVPVLWASEKGITEGVGDNRFGPDIACTRAQVVTYLWRMNGSAPSFPAGTKFWVPFYDISENAYYRTAAGWARSNNFITGYGDEDTFAPDAYCTRAQVAIILYKMFGGR